VNSMLAKLLRSSLVIITLLCAWWLLVKITGVPKFILPPPDLVLKRLWQLRETLWHHTLVTGTEVLLGLLLGLCMGLFSALFMLMFKPVRLWFLPLVLASQAIPVFALAPVLVLWLGFGMASKVVMAALIIYFPVTMTCFDGLRHTHSCRLWPAHGRCGCPNRCDHRRVGWLW